MVTDSGMAGGIATVSSHCRQPSLSPARTGLEDHRPHQRSASKLWREERSARLIAGPKPRLCQFMQGIDVTEGASICRFNRLGAVCAASERAVSGRR